MNKLASIRRKFVIILPLTLLNPMVYILLNRFLLLTPYEWPTLEIDNALPFLVWTVASYLLLLVSDVVVLFFVQRWDHFVDLLREIRSFAEFRRWIRVFAKSLNVMFRWSDPMLIFSQTNALFGLIATALRQRIGWLGASIWTIDYDGGRV